MSSTSSEPSTSQEARSGLKGDDPSFRIVGGYDRRTAGTGVGRYLAPSKRGQV